MSITPEYLDNIINLNLNIYEYIKKIDNKKINDYLKLINNINLNKYNDEFEKIFSSWEKFTEIITKINSIVKKIYNINDDEILLTTYLNSLNKIKFYIYIKIEYVFRLYYDKNFIKIEKNNIQFINHYIKDEINLAVRTDTVKYDDITPLYFTIKKIYMLGLKHIEQKEFNYINLNPEESIINIISKSFKIMLVLLITGFIFFINHLNTNNVIIYYYYYAFFVSIFITLFLFVIIIFIISNKTTFKYNMNKIFLNNWKIFASFFVFLFFFIIFLEVSGFNEYLEQITNSEASINIANLENTQNFVDKLSYYKAHDPVFRSVFYLLLSLIILLISYNLGKIVKYGSLCYENNYKKCKYTLIIAGIVLAVSFWVSFYTRLKSSFMINTFLSGFISVIIIIFTYGLIKTDYLLKHFNTKFSFKQMLELSKNYDMFKDDIKLGEYSGVDINILSEDMALAIDYISLNQDNIDQIFEEMIKNNKIKLLTNIINRIDNINILYKIFVYLLNKSIEDPKQIYSNILNNINIYKIIDCSAKNNDLLHINNSLLTKLLNKKNTILSDLI